MKRKSMIFVLALLMAVLMAGCGCKHEWKEADCTTPKTCALCGETEGEALGHNWAEATCANAKHCSVCDQTEGEPLEHTLTEANYQQPAKCTVCGAEVGTPLEAYFEKMGAEINVTELGVPYNNKRHAQQEPSYVSNGTLTIASYETFVSDDTHEKLDGYEWKRVTFNILTPYSEGKYGDNTWIQSMDYYMASSSDDAYTLENSGTSLLNWNGKEYEWFGAFSELEPIGGVDCNGEDGWLRRIEFVCHVPAGYDGNVLVFYSETPEITAKKEANASGLVIHEAILKSPDILCFRLN